MTQGPANAERLIALLGVKYASPDCQRALEPLGSVELSKFPDSYIGHLDYPSIGLAIVLQEGEWLPKLASPEEGKDLFVAAFMCFGPRDADHSRFSGELPEALQFGLSSASVVKLLGQPTRSGGGGKSQLGEVPQWLVFSRGSYAIHCQFGTDGELELVTVQLSDAYSGNPLGRH